MRFTKPWTSTLKCLASHTEFKDPQSQVALSGRVASLTAAG